MWSVQAIILNHPHSHKYSTQPESTTPLKHVTKLGILHNLTLICVWSNLEAGRYLETLKIYESKPADSIMGKVEEDFESRFIDCLTSVKTVNKRDVTNLGSNFGVNACSLLVFDDT